MNGNSENNVLLEINLKHKVIYQKWILYVVFYDLLTFHAFHCGGIPAISPFDEAVRVILARGSGVPERVEDGVRERPGHEGSDAECVRSHRQRSRDIHLWFAKLFAHSKDKTCTKRVKKSFVNVAHAAKLSHK